MGEGSEKILPAGTRGTLGHVLYGGPSRPVVSESAWVALVRRMAAGDALALHSMYERTHRLVFTLILRITSSRQTAERLTLDVYHQMWKGSPHYDPASGTVLAWVMKHARVGAIERVRAQQGINGPHPKAQPALLTIDMPDFRDVMDAKHRRHVVENALTVLAPAERKTIELAYFSELSYSEVAKRLTEPPATIRARIRSALSQLRHALAMSKNGPANDCPYSELACAHAVRALPAHEVAGIETHLSSCADCRRELESLAPVLAAFISWPTDLLRPAPALQSRLADRIAAETGMQAGLPETPSWSGGEWDNVATGISCYLLATDEDKRLVSMLVRLAPGGEYPPHRHAGVEELHLLDGELWIDERKLYSGDYNRAEPGTADHRVWSETGCTCVLITSTDDILR